MYSEIAMVHAIVQITAGKKTLSPRYEAVVAVFVIYPLRGSRSLKQGVPEGV